MGGFIYDFLINLESLVGQVRVEMEDYPGTGRIPTLSVMGTTCQLVLSFITTTEAEDPQQWFDYVIQNCDLNMDSTRGRRKCVLGGKVVPYRDSRVAQPLSQPQPGSRWLLD